MFHRRGLAKALGMKSGGGNVFMRTMNRKGLGSVIPQELREKLENPIIFKPLAGDPAHGVEATTLIEVCDAIWEARKQGKLTARQYFLGIQAEIILRSSAKIGIIALVDEATGYIRDKQKYAPLANSNGAILEMLDEKNPIVYASGGRKYRMFQFLTDVVGLPALRAHLWQVVGIGNACTTKESFDRAFLRAFPQSGEQGELFDDF